MANPAMRLPVFRQRRREDPFVEFGLNENVRLAIRLVAIDDRPVNVDISTLVDNEEVFGVKTSMFFKKTRIYRIIDKEHNTLIYLAISSKVVSGSPANAVSIVPIMRWGSQ
jgi:CreA protein